jgi:hypothetical protein
MEEGIYEVDVKTLKVTELFADNQGQIGHYDDAAKGAAFPACPATTARASTPATAA